MQGLEKKSYPSESEIREFWEWCGFKLRCPPDKDAYGRGIWDYPEGTYGDLELDLNNLFKYAVPKLQMIQLITQRAPTIPNFVPVGYRAFASIGALEYGVEDKDPALALFWAIYEVVKESNK